MSKICPKCGAEIADESKNCDTCGSEIKESSSEQKENNLVQAITLKIIDRKAVKKKAREKLKDNLWNIWKPILVVGLIQGIISYILETIGNGALAFLAPLIVSPLSVGVTLYNLNFIRGKEFNINQVFGFYKENTLKIMLTTFLVGLFTVLWSFLFVIPGIIAAISYSMVTYLLADNADGDETEIINKSKKMMDGYKWDYFVFELSFVGWVLLCGITLGIASVYVIPYITISNAMYYDELKTIKE